MKNFVKYINAIAVNPILPKKAEHTTTILMPELDTMEGIYRTLLPSYVLNGENNLRVLITGLSEKMDISINAKDFQITRKLIAETDHFVFPFVSFPLRPIVDEIKKVKPTMKFSYYVDVNYYLMPEAYPFAKEFRTAEMVKSIEDNIRAVDRVITTNEALIDYIIEKIKERYPGQTFGTTFHCQPLFIMPDLMKTEYTSITEKNKVKVLIIGDDYQFSDINFIKGILKDFKIKYKETGEIHIIGFDGKKHNKNYLQGLEFTHHPKVPFIKYFELIKHIGPDVLLIPANNSKFNATSKNYIKYLECAHMNIAVIAPNIPPYSKLITTNENGFLCPDKDSYLFQLDTMFTEPSKAAGTLGIAYATAVEYNITEAGNIEKMKKIYFPDHGKK